MGILVWVDKREELTRFCGWQGSGITWRMGKDPKVGRAGKFPEFQRQGGAREGCAGKAAAATCGAPSHVGAGDRKSVV